MTKAQPKKSAHSQSHAGIVASLRRELHRVVGASIEGEQHVVLADVPEHSNVGDHAIFLGELAVLRNLGIRIRGVAGTGLHAWPLLHAHCDTPIILNGGGNLGDLWSRHQQFREAVLLRYPGRRVVVMPQSIHFQDRRNLERAKRVFGQHQRMTLLVRDFRSYEFARGQFDVDVGLAPDAAFGLHVKREESPSYEVYGLVRQDRERALPSDVEREWEFPVTDWLETLPPSTATAAGVAFRTHRVAKRLPASVGTSALLSRQFETISRWHLARGVSILSHGRHVVTDRLHAHILCMLLCTPHTALDNSYGKLKSFLETWTCNSPLVAQVSPEAQPSATHLAQGEN